MEKKFKIYESTLFVALLLFISGFINAYATAVLNTSVTFHTGTLMKLGINLGNFKFDAAFKGIITIIIFLAGVITCEITKKRKNVFMNTNLIICIFCTLITVFFSKSNPSIATYSLNYLAGIYMNTFTSWNGANTSITVMTANLKKYGTALYNKFINKDSKVNLISFTIVTIAFTCGAFAGTILTNLLNTYNYLALLFVTLLFIIIMFIINKEQ